MKSYHSRIHIDLYKAYQVDGCKVQQLHDLEVFEEETAHAQQATEGHTDDCAGGAVVKMPSVAARAVPPVSVARLARCLVRPGWLNGVRCWARAQRHGGV